MKINTLKLFGLITICIISVCLSQGIDPKGFPRTPKALDLEDHFGTEPVLNLYGPQTISGDMNRDLAREFNTVDGIRTVTKIRNLHELNPREVIHGELNNTAYDATRIIKPEYAVPKAKVDTTIVHDAVVNTPVQVATHYETKDVSVMNRITGEVSNKQVTTEKPVISVLKNLRKVSTDNTSYVNLDSGKLIDTQQRTGLVGI
jgi:hypothetical protein